MGLQKPALRNARIETPVPRFEGVGDAVAGFIDMHPLMSFALFIGGGLGLMSYLGHRDRQYADTQVQIFENKAKDWDGKQEIGFLQKQMETSYNVDATLQVWALRKVLETEGTPEQKAYILLQGLAFNQPAVSEQAEISVRKFLRSGELKNEAAWKLLDTMQANSPGYHDALVGENVWEKRRNSFPDAYLQAEKQLVDLINKGF